MHSTFLYAIRAEKERSEQNKYKSVCPIFLHQVQQQIVFSSFIYCLISFFGCLLQSRCKSMNWSFFSLHPRKCSIIISIVVVLFYTQQIDITMFWNCSTKKEADKSAMQTKFIRTKLKTWEKIEQPQRFIRCHRFKWQSPNKWVN